MALEFARLIKDPTKVAAVFRKFEKTIRESFQVDQDRLPEGQKVTITDTEVRRRFKLLEDGFRLMRGDLAWGLDRSLDTLPQYLRAKLDLKPWEPSKRKLWVPTDGRL